MEQFTLIIDGGTVGSNPGIGVAAVLLKDSEGQTVHTENSVLGPGVSNNQAEYHALLLGLDVAKRHGATQVLVLSDSKLMVNQVTCVWAIHNLLLRGLADQAWQLINEFDKVIVRWVPRTEVAEADALLNAVRPESVPASVSGSQVSLHDWLRKPEGLWYHLPDGRTLYKLTYYVQVTGGAAPSIDFKIWQSLWDRNRECWIVWRPWGKYPLTSQQVQFGVSLGDLEDRIQEPIMAPLCKIRSEFFDAPFVGKWGGRLLILRSDAWEHVDETLAD